ncbi:MAG: hypothetical protein WD672_04530 [Woeseia sp.]
MTRQTQSRLIAVAVLLWLTACDPVAPFFLRNGMAEPVMIQATFQGEMRREALLQPGIRMAFMHPGGNIEHLSVSSEGEVIHEFDKAELERMAQSVVDPRQVTWNIEANLIRPLTQTELDRLNDQN